MKIRIHGDSIRFRLNRREVESFAATGRVESAIHFAGSTLGYALESDGVLTDPQAEYAEGVIRVRVPARLAGNWTGNDDEVEMRGVQAIAPGRTLDILIEKDFQCMHKGESHKDPDAYPNPAATPAA